MERLTRSRFHAAHDPATPHPRPRRHRQDRPPRRRAPRGARRPRPDRLALGAARRSTGTTARPGGRARRRRAPSTSRSIPTSPCRARPSAVGAFAAPGGGSGRAAARAALGPRRGGGAARGARRPRRRAAARRSCAQLVRAELQRGASCSRTCAPASSRCRSDDVREPFVDVDDIADVAVAALTGDGHAGELYELTGPRLLTFADAVAEIARDAGATAYLRCVRGTRRRWRPTGSPVEVALDRVPLRRGPRRAQRAGHRRRAAGARPPPRDFGDYAATPPRPGPGMRRAGDRRGAVGAG